MQQDDPCLQAKLRGLLEQGKTVVLATANSNGHPQASYAPFCFDGTAFFLYLSTLSRHCANLFERPQASLLFIEDEGVSKQLFARRRLTLDCIAVRVSRDSEQFRQAIDDFTARFGEIMTVLEPLQDFNLWRLQPREAVLVMGFGQAFKVDPDCLSKFDPIR